MSSLRSKVASCSRDYRGVLGLYSVTDGVTASDFENRTTPTLELRRMAVFDVSQSGLNVEGKRREKPSAPVNAKGLKTKREVSCKDLTPLVSGLRGWFWPRESVLTG